MPERKEPLAAIEAATHRLSRAEVELSTALEQLPDTERADKQMISTRMRRALDEILAARIALSALRASDPGPTAGETSDPPADPSAATKRPGSDS